MGFRFGTITLILAAVAGLAGFTMLTGRGQTVLEKAERGETISVRSDDAEMAAARRKARDTLPEFLALWRSPRSSTSKFSVKVAVRDQGKVEYFWIMPFEQDNERFSGRLNNSPETVHNVKRGDKIAFAESEIVDWLYLDGDRMKGNFTACALFRRVPRQEAEAAIKRFGMSCEL
jgi:uncharacterized protein YegJ (DUF2314 family)